jgi:hypothetical protein
MVKSAGPAAELGVSFIQPTALIVVPAVIPAAASSACVYRYANRL